MTATKGLFIVQFSREVEVDPKHDYAVMPLTIAGGPSGATDVWEIVDVERVEWDHVANSYVVYFMLGKVIVELEATIRRDQLFQVLSM
ncbi:MAG: hypothetical protein WBC49_06065 [Thermoplasmata archaeon]